MNQVINALNRARPVQKSGADADAIAFVMRTNKRRNLNSGQWACIANEAEELLVAIREGVEKERREKQAASQAKLSDNKLPDSQPQRSTEKVADLFNTNRTYVNQAAKIKDKAPDVFEKVKAGKMTMQDANQLGRRNLSPDALSWRSGEGITGRRRRRAATIRAGKL